MSLNPEVWGPHYWFFLHTIALTYPSHPNTVTKKKYYNFIQDLPLFIPDAKIAKEFSSLLDNYPVTPYLDSRPSFNKWMHFIHNKINYVLNKPQVNILDAANKYKENYFTKLYKFFIKCNNNSIFGHCLLKIQSSYMESFLLIFLKTKKRLLCIS